MAKPDSQTEKRKGERIEHRLSIIGPIAGLFATILATYTKLPPLVQYIMILLFGVLTLVSVYYVLWHHIASLFNKAVSAKKHHSLVKKYLREFSLFVDRFCEHSQNDRIDNLPRAFKDIDRSIPEFNYPNSLLNDLSNFVPTFKEWVREFRKGDFQLLITWFEFVLGIYHRQLVLEPLRQLRRIDQNKLKKHEKEVYENTRERYVRFLDDYENFARAINKEADEPIALAYFDKPCSLSSVQ